MHCYCLSLLQSNPMGIDDEDFSDLKVAESDGTPLLLCKDWLTQRLRTEALVRGSAGILVAINCLAGILLRFCSKQEKHHSENA